MTKKYEKRSREINVFDNNMKKLWITWKFTEFLLFHIFILIQLDSSLYSWILRKTLKNIIFKILCSQAWLNYPWIPLPIYILLYNWVYHGYIKDFFLVELPSEQTSKAWFLSKLMLLSQRTRRSNCNSKKKNCNFVYN